MTAGFVFAGLPVRVVFGAGTLARLPEELDRLGGGPALVISTPGQRELGARVVGLLGGRAAGLHAGAVMHTPVEATEAALEVFRASGAGALVAVGGGSAIGLSKALALRTGADQLVIPTTYAGSETTDILGETAAGAKTTRRDPAIRPEAVLYDVDLTLDLPLSVSLPSAMNALAHAVEGLYAPDRNPITDFLARDAAERLAAGLPRLLADPRDGEARAALLYAAWGCSVVLGQTTMALHHKLAHVLGGSFGLPHAETHAVLLPHSCGFNEGAVDGVLDPVARAFGADSAAAGIRAMQARLGMGLRLADLGLAEADLDRAADLAMMQSYANPRPFDRAAIRALLGRAWAGEIPEAG